MDGEKLAGELERYIRVQKDGHALNNKARKDFEALLDQVVLALRAASVAEAAIAECEAWRKWHDEDSCDGDNCQNCKGVREARARTDAARAGEGRGG